jgi:spermidine/putrescine transport system substrate-binding protein
MSFFAEDPEALAKIQTGVHVDLVHPCESYMGLYVENGLVQPIDTSRIEYWEDLHPKLREIGQFDGVQYFVPWDWGYESILVRTDLVEEVPDSWADLWDPQYAGKIMLWDSGQANYGMTALALGIKDPWNELTPENVERVKQKLIELKPNLLTYWTDYTQTYDMPASGEAWLTANAWQDAFGYLTTEGFETAYIEPTEGRMGWACGYGILKDAVNQDRVYEFLNAASAPESAAGLGNNYWYGHANTHAVELIEDYIVEFMKLDQVDALFEQTIFYQPITEEQRQMVIKMWDEVKATP